MEKGDRPVPATIISKLISNEMGWETSALTEAVHSVSASASNNSTAKVNIGTHSDAGQLLALMKEIELLRAQLAEEKARSEKYWDMIQKLMK